jgi:hypothetical protein
MSLLVGLKKDQDDINVLNEKIINENKLKIEEKTNEVGLKAKELEDTRKSVSASAENSRTGKSLPRSFIDQLEGMEQKKERDLISVRLENIKLRNKLRRSERLLKQKDFFFNSRKNWLMGFI